jgi:plastocyanin
MPGRCTCDEMRRRSLAALLVTSLLLLIAALAAPATQAGGGCHMPGAGDVYTEGEGTTVIRMDVCSFAPTITRVPVGTSIRFLNTSNIEHAVVGRSGTWGSEILPVGKEFSETFAAAGTYPYSCPLHPGMVGAIVVGGDAAAAPAPAAPAAPAPTAPAMTSTSSEVSSPDTSGPDPLPLAIAGVAGLGIGALAGVLMAGAFATRRRNAGG